MEKEFYQPEYASFDRRLYSFVADLMVIGFLILPIASFFAFYLFKDSSSVHLLLGMMAENDRTFEPVAVDMRTIMPLIGFYLIQLLCVFLYFILLWAAFGATPGKMLFGIKIVRKETLERAGFIRMFFRGILYPLSIFSFIFYALFPSKLKNSQFLHDKILDLVVIRTGKGLFELSRITSMMPRSPKFYDEDKESK